MLLKLLKTALAYLTLFPAIGMSLEWLGLESNAYFAFYGVIFALTTDYIVTIKHKD